MKILIIEDDDGIRRLLRYDLRQFYSDVDSAKDGAEAIEFVEKNNYDVIIVDWMLPVYSGIELVKKFRSQGNSAIMMMLTVKDDESDILEAFDAGVDDYMTKPFSPRELTARIRAHLRRAEVSEDKDLIEIGNLVVDLSQYQVKVDNQEIIFTKKEFDLLTFLLNNLNIVLTRDQILNEIWNFDYDGDTRIVDVHIFKLRRKLEDADIQIDSIRGVGYIAKE